MKSNIDLRNLFLLVTLTIVGVSGCDSKRSDPVTQEPATRNLREGRSSEAWAESPVKAGQTALTEEMRSHFGAASWLPASASYFSTTVRLKDQWDAIQKSRAIQKLLALPVVFMGQQQLLRSPPYLKFQELLQTNPLFSRAMEVVDDAVSREVFVYAGAKMSELSGALGRIYLRLMLTQDALLPGPGGAIAQILELKDALRVPPAIVGFSLSKPEAALELLDDLVAEFGGQVPLPILQQTIDGGKYHSVVLSAKMMIPPRERQTLNMNLLRQGHPEETVRDLNAFIDSHNFALSVGVRGSYLLFSIGPDTDHLGQFAQGPTLAESPVLEPARRHFKSGMVSLVYVAKDLAFGCKVPEEELLADLDVIMESVSSEIPTEELRSRVRTDLHSLGREINNSMPDASPWVSMGFINRGIESFSFSTARPLGLDTSQPLTILSKAGDSPLAASASRAISSEKEYDRVVHWLGVGFDYFEEFALPEMSADDRKEYQRFHDIFLPAIRELHAATRDFLIPALDGCQSLLTLDGAGLLEGIPGVPIQLLQPLRVPRPALVVEVKDIERFTQAFALYRKTINEFVTRMAEIEPDLSSFQIPEFESRPFAGGTLYSYKSLFDLGPDLEPHALILGNTVIVAVFPAHSEGLAASSTALSDDVVKLSAAAGSCYRVDLQQLTGLVLDDAAVFLGELVRQGEIPAGAAPMVHAHLLPLRQSLGALKSFTGRIYMEDGYQIHHSWLHVADLSDE